MYENTSNETETILVEDLKNDAKNFDNTIEKGISFNKWIYEESKELENRQLALRWKIYDHAQQEGSHMRRPF